jgi:hypothetical protein
MMNFEMPAANLPTPASTHPAAIPAKSLDVGCSIFPLYAYTPVKRVGGENTKGGNMHPWLSETGPVSERVGKK